MSEPHYKFISENFDSSPSGLTGCEVAFVGMAVDERGKSSINAIKTATNSVHTVQFDPENQRLHLDNRETKPERIALMIQSATRIVLDGTTLGLGEILHILMSAKLAGKKAIEFLYAEPKAYTKSASPTKVDSTQRKFHLTQNRQFIGINGFNSPLQKGMEAAHILFLGFEPDRVINALVQRGDINRETYQLLVVIGVPAFQSGWELNSIKPHLAVLDEQKINQSMISYCAAASVSEAYLTIWDLYKRLRDDRRVFYVSPLGTKPHTIATTLFLLETKGAHWVTSLYYDHPQRVDKRSSGESTWHHVKVIF